MFLGYNTNGMAHHDLESGLALLARAGYRGVGLTLDYGLLNPFAPDFASSLARAKTLLFEHRLRSVVETGARFLLDPERKHEPTLVSADAAGRARRIDFYRRAVDAAAELGADCVSLWSGVLREDISREAALDRLAGGLGELLAYADQRGVMIGFEPEPGMLVDTMARFEELLTRVDHPRLGLTLDMGHLHCMGETPIADVVHKWAPRLVNVHIEDMRSGVHEHLPFGEGEIDFPPVLRALAECGYAGGLYVELSRDSHRAPEMVRRSYEFLTPLCPRK